MLRYHSPSDILAPFAHYSHGVEVPPGQRLLFCTGQLGIDPEGAIPADAAAQTRLCFSNIDSVLKQAAMGREHIVRINAFVSGREHLADYMKVRDELFPEPAPASTLLIVSGFSREAFKVEIEVIAAAPENG